MKRTFLAAAAVFLTCSFGLAAEKRTGWVDGIPRISDWMDALAIREYGFE